MKIVRTNKNHFLITEKGEKTLIKVPVGLIYCNSRTRDQHFRINENILPDIPTEERYFYVRDYSSAKACINDCIQTMIAYAEDLYMIRRLETTPRTTKTSDLPVGVYEHITESGLKVFRVNDPLGRESWQSFSISTEATKEEIENVKETAIVARYNLEEVFIKERRFCY